MSAWGPSLRLSSRELLGQCTAFRGTPNPTLWLCRSIGSGLLMFGALGGAIGDRYGYHWAVAMGSTAVVAGYLLMSVITAAWALFPAYTLVGVGSGTMFAGALSQAVITGKAWALGIVSLAMSLSLSITNTLQQGIANELCYVETDEAGRVQGDPACWRTAVVVYAIAVAAAGALGCPLMVRPVALRVVALFDACCSGGAVPPAQGYASVDEEAARGAAPDGAPAPASGLAATSQATAPDESALEAGSGGALVEMSGPVGAAADAAQDPSTPLTEGGEDDARSQCSSTYGSLGGRVEEGAVLGMPVPTQSQTAGEADVEAEAFSYIHRPVKWRQAAQVCREPYFLVLALAYAMGMGTGVYVVTALPDMYGDVVSPCVQAPEAAPCVRDEVPVYDGALSLAVTLSLFAVFNGVCNVAAPQLAQRWHEAGRLRLHHCVAGNLIVAAILLGASAALSLGVGSMSPNIGATSKGLQGMGAALLALQGATFGISLSVLPQAALDAFGAPNYGTIFGLLQLGGIVYFISLPPLARAVADASHGWGYNHAGVAVATLFTGVLLAVSSPRSARWAAGAAE